MASLASLQPVVQAQCLGRNATPRRKRNSSQDEKENLKKLRMAASSDGYHGLASARHEEVRHERAASVILPDVFPATKPGDRGANTARQLLMRERLKAEANMKAKAGSGGGFDAQGQETTCTLNQMPPPAIRPPRPSKPLVPSQETAASVGGWSSLPVAECMDNQVDMMAALKGIAHARLATPARPQHLDAKVLPAAGKSEWSQPRTSFPVDWSLKSSAYFRSQSSFEWCRSATAMEEQDGLDRFFRSSSGAGSVLAECRVTAEANSSSDHAAAFREALHSWRYPDIQLPEAVLNAVSKSAAQGSAEETFLHKRIRAWEEAFCSLFYSFRGGGCESFYYCSPHAVIFFCLGPIVNRAASDCCAFITRSTRGFRELLNNEGINFELPLWPNEKADAMNLESTASMAVADNHPASLVFLESPNQVQGLFDLLLNHRHFHATAMGNELPTLIAPSPFTNASVTTMEFQCRKMQTAQEQSEGDCKHAAEGGSLYSLEIKDSLLPPWVILRLCSLFKVSQRGHFEVSFTTMPSTHLLNIVPVHAPSGQDLSTGPKGTYVGVNQEDVRQPGKHNQLGPHYVKQAKCQDGFFHVTLLESSIVGSTTEFLSG